MPIKHGRQVDDQKVACSVEPVLGLRCGCGYFSLDQRISYVLGVHEDILLILT